MQTIKPHTESTRGQLGQGMYSLENLRLYLALSGSTDDSDRALDWLTDTLNPSAHRARQPDYAFTDLVSLFVVRELRKLGLPRRIIREAEAHMRDVLGLDRPLSREDISTDKVEVFFATGNGQIESANPSSKRHRTGQQTSRIMIAAYLHDVRYGEDGTAASWSPSPGVVLDPQIQFGEPVLDGTRLPTRALAEVVELHGRENAMDWLGATSAQAEAAAAFERRLAALRN